MTAWTAQDWSTAQRLRGDGKSMDEIAERLGRPTHAVEMKFYRAGRAKRDARHGEVNTGRAASVRPRMTNTSTTQHRSPSQSHPHLTAENVHAALALLIGDGRVSVADVRNAAEHRRQVARIEAELARLRGEASPVARRSRSGHARKPFHMTPAMARARKIQGRYIGGLKRFPAGAVRRKAKAIAKEKGVAAAVAFLAGQGK